MAWHRQQTFAAEANAPSAARSFAQDQLLEALGPDAPQLLNDAALIVSELVTNAVRAGSRAIEVELSIAGGDVELRVGDDAHGWPALQHPGPSDTGGRGLILVSALASRWGVAHAGAHRKLVWVCLAVDPSERAAVHGFA